eukprot:scpid90083/ scgid0621/ 
MTSLLLVRAGQKISLSSAKSCVRSRLRFQAIPEAAAPCLSIVRGVAMSSSPITSTDSSGDAAKPKKSSTKKSEKSEVDPRIIELDSIDDVQELDVYQKLSDEHQDIAFAHHTSMQLREKFYRDPETGNYVQTSFSHRNRGKCCGCGCRHCPFMHTNVADDKKGEKSFNGLFYV